MDYLRQLANDEKRSRCVTVATITGEDLVGPIDPIGALVISAIPQGSIVGKIYAVVTKPFAIGSTLTWGFVDTAGAIGASLLTDLDLTVVGASRSQKLDGGIYTLATVTAIVPNTAAFASNIGEVKLCIELTEPETKSGMYSA